MMLIFIFTSTGKPATKKDIARYTYDRSDIIDGIFRELVAGGYLKENEA